MGTGVHIPPSPQQGPDPPPQHGDGQHIPEVLQAPVAHAHTLAAHLAAAGARCSPPGAVGGLAVAACKAPGGQEAVEVRLMRGRAVQDTAQRVGHTELVLLAPLHNLRIRLSVVFCSDPSH